MTNKNIFVCKCSAWNVDRVTCWSCGVPTLPISSKQSRNALEKEKNRSQEQKPSASVAQTHSRTAGRPAAGLTAALIFILVSVPVVTSQLSKPPPAVPTVPRTVDLKPAGAADRTSSPSTPKVVVELPPALPLDAPLSVVNQATVPAVQSHSHTNPQTLDLVALAPGCPQKLATRASAQAFCRWFDETGCKTAEQTCVLEKASATYSAKCVPKTGTYIPPPPIDPETRARLGLANTDMLIATTAEIERRISTADDYAANRRLSRAIAEYTAALKLSSDHVSAIVGRAKAYEGQGDRARAIADYCRIIQLQPNYDTYHLAVDRVARLSGQSSGLDQQPPSSVVSTADKKLPQPSTGVMEKGHRKSRVAPLKIETESGADYLLKLVSIADETDTITIYVRGGEPYSTKVPLGSYKIRAATGKTWYDKNVFFGPDTRFFRLQSKDGKGPEASLIARFWQERNKIFGMTLTFKSAVDGNMTQETISKSDF